MDPGQPVTWSVRIDGHHEHRGYMDEADTYHGPTGKWIEAVTYTRTGTVWSQATSPNAWWVQPDDDPFNPVVIRRHGRKFSLDHREGELYQTREGEGWREAIRRAENVRKHGIFPVVESEYTSRSWSGPGTTWRNIVWHADHECPLAAGKPRDDGQGMANGRDWTVHTAADALVGRIQLASAGPFCPRCVMLEDTPVRELASA